jgi:NAD(P)-dependent dehydrogenase (short-subunit alcohol dehydrogenase family)
MRERWLEGRSAVVTGGGRGIGAAIASELARLGARVTVMGRDQGRLDAQVLGMRAAYGGDYLASTCDVTDAASVADSFARARTAMGDAWILVNNAGAADSDRFMETTLEQWNGMLASNLTSAFLCTQQVLPGMQAARGGRIVNIGSTASVRGAARLSAYTAAKHGLLGLTRALAAEVARQGITVNCVCPAYTDTGMARTAVDNLVRGRGISSEEAEAMIVRTIPRGRLIEPEEVASAVGWLCSPGAAAVSGQAVVLGGGEP